MSQLIDFRRVGRKCTPLRFALPAGPNDRLMVAGDHSGACLCFLVVYRLPKQTDSEANEIPARYRIV